LLRQSPERIVTGGGRLMGSNKTFQGDRESHLPACFRSRAWKTAGQGSYVRPVQQISQSTTTQGPPCTSLSTAGFAAFKPSSTPSSSQRRAPFSEARALSKAIDLARENIKVQLVRGRFVLGRYGRDVLSKQNRAKAVEFARQLALALTELRAHLTFEQMARAMNERCIPTARGKQWHTATVHRLFRRTRTIQCAP
jgi:Recombinase